MATLQKIRNRGGLLVSIIIGLALLAFVVSDALNSGASMFNSSRNEIGEIAGEKISIIDYQNAIQKNEETMKMMYQLPSLTEEQQAETRESTWQEIIRNIVMNREYESLGISVSGEELFDILAGNNINPSIRQLFGNADAQQIRETVKQVLSLDAGDPQKAYWLNIEEQFTTSQKMTKYNTLLTKGLFVTDAEAQVSVNNSASKTDISYIVKNYSSIPDSIINITESEIRDYYKSHEQLFQQEESRRISYVSFDITPSSDDHMETRKWISNLIAEFAVAENPAEFVDLSSDIPFDVSYFRQDEISNDSLADFLSKNEQAVYGPYMENNFYKISKVSSTMMLPDSVRARHILIGAENNNYVQATAIADSLADLLRKGANFETLARAHSTDQGSAINGGDLGWFGQKTMVQPFSDTAFFAKPNDIKVVATQFGVHIIQVRERSKLVKKLQIATVSKEITPSQATINNAYNQARTFASAVATSEDFDQKVEEAGVLKRIASVGKNDQSIAGMEGVREFARHVYLAKKVNQTILNNEGTNIFDAEDRFIVAVLTEINEQGVAPINNVAGTIRQELIRKKKAEIINKEMAEAIEGSQSLLSVGQKMNLDVKDATNISFGTFQIPGAGIEPKVIATACLSENGKISAPIDGTSGVYILVVNNRINDETTPDMTESTRTAMSQSNMYKASYLGNQVLMKNANIKDNRYKFY